MSDNIKKTDPTDTKARREHIKEALNAVAAWSARASRASPSCAAEEELRRVVAAVYSGLGEAIQKVHKEIDESLAQEAPENKVLFRFTAPETLAVTARLVQLYAANQAVEAAFESITSEIKHVGAELTHAVAKYEPAAHGGEFKPKIFQQLILKPGEGPADARDATRRLLEMAPKDLEAASKACPDGWEEKVHPGWVRDMASLLATAEKTRLIVAQLMAGKLSTGIVLGNSDSPPPLRHLAEFIQNEGDSETSAKPSLSATLANYAAAVKEVLKDGMAASNCAADPSAPQWLRELCQILVDPETDFGAPVRGLLAKAMSDP